MNKHKTTNPQDLKSLPSALTSYTPNTPSTPASSRDPSPRDIPRQGGYPPAWAIQTWAKAPERADAAAAATFHSSCRLGRRRRVMRSSAVGDHKVTEYLYARVDASGQAGLVLIQPTVDHSLSGERIQIYFCRLCSWPSNNGIAVIKRSRHLTGLWGPDLTGQARTMADAPPGSGRGLV